MKPAAIAYLSSCVKPERSGKMRDVLEKRTKNVKLVLENISDPHNAAACLRTAEGFGIQQIHVVEGYHSFPKDVAQGSDRWLTLYHHRSPVDCLAKLDSDGYTVFASDLSPAAKPITEMQFASHSSVSNNECQKVALVFGNEGLGVSTFFRKRSAGSFILPMVGVTQSFNLSVSVAISLTYMRMFKMLTPDLSQEEKDDLMFRWLVRDLGMARPNVRDLLARKGLVFEDL